MEPNETKQSKNKLNITLDTRIIIGILLLIIAGMLAVWQPWTDKNTSQDRTVTVTGEANLKAEPDEFMFSPAYEFKNADKEAALGELTKKSEAVVAKLKSLGVADSKIKTDSDGHNYNLYYDTKTQQNTYSLRLTITVDNKEMAQKVQDYLLTTAPTGSVSPQASFSDVKRKELENKARDEATKDARSKADQSARNLTFKVGKVKSINDDAGFGGIMPLYGRADIMISDGAAPAPEKSSLAVQPGENDLRYSVTVIYYLK